MQVWSFDTSASPVPGFFRAAFGAIATNVALLQNRTLPAPLFFALTLHSCVPLQHSTTLATLIQPITIRLTPAYAWCAAVLFGLSPASHAVDSVSFEFGTGNRTRLARVGLQWAWEKQWLKSNGNHIGGYWDLTLGYWHGTRFQNQPGETQDILAIGFAPVFRLQRDDLKGAYGEAGIGVRYLSKLYDNNDRQLSTKLEFGSHLGAGYVFRNGLDVGLKIQHFSNGSIKKPNDGVNFAIVRVSYWF
jgi:lipid A 3-O-deacylase